MDLLRISERVASARTSGQVWDLGMFRSLETEALAVADEAGEDEVKEAVVGSFDSAFGTDYASGDVPFFSPVEDLSVSDLFHELLHHAFSPKSYTDYASHLEGALHEHAIRNYQEYLDSGESLFTAFEELGFDGNRYNGREISPEDAQAFLKSYKADVAKAENPGVRALLADSARKMEAVVRRGEFVAERIAQESSRLEKLANDSADELVPDGAEEGVRRWYRQLTVDLRSLVPVDDEG